VDVKGSVSQKTSEYKRIFKSAKITDVQGYIDQTFGNTREQLRLLIFVTIIIAILVTVLITALFSKTLIAKDMSRIAIMRSMGISLSDIKVQYLTRVLVVLIAGILAGTIIANTVGHWLFSAVLSVIGAANIEFIVNPLEAYIVSPVFLMVVVIITTLTGIKSIESYDISDINVE
jgi:putative ABC transport system permease protein